jgi:hypothetical protein
LTTRRGRNAANTLRKGSYGGGGGVGGGWQVAVAASLALGSCGGQRPAAGYRQPGWRPGKKKETERRGGFNGLGGGRQGPGGSKGGGARGQQKRSRATNRAAKKGFTEDRFRNPEAGNRTRALGSMLSKETHALVSGPKAKL